MAFNLSNPGRTIEFGVIVMAETEVLDVAPVDLLHGISTRFIHNLPLSDELKAKAPVVNFHWITETGRPALLTSNMKVEATVRMLLTLDHAIGPNTYLAFLRNCSATRYCHHWCLSAWIRAHRSRAGIPSQGAR